MPLGRSCISGSLPPTNINRGTLKADPTPWVGLSSPKRRRPAGRRTFPMTSTESTYVFADRIARLAAVRTIAHDEWRASIELCGELDIANAHQLRDELEMHLAAGRRVIRVDASRVEFNQQGGGREPGGQAAA